MIRIGIVGSDNSHAIAFSKLANLPDEKGRFRYDDVRVTAIYGAEKERTKEVAEAGKIETICSTPEEMLPWVDAVMVVFRHGNLHYAHALPFLEAGIPTWVDKPFTIFPTETLALIEASKKHHTLLTGGSTCKFCYDVLALQQKLHSILSSSNLISANFNFPGELDSPYGGIYFYGGHAIEIMTTIFGNHPISVKTDVHCGNLIALFKYERFAVTIHFAEVSEFYATLYAESGVITQPIDISTVYQEGFRNFVESLRSFLNTKNSQMPFVQSEVEYHSLLRPVLILQGLEKAIQTGEEELLYV